MLVFDLRRTASELRWMIIAGGITSILIFRAFWEIPAWQMIVASAAIGYLADYATRIHNGRVIFVYVEPKPVPDGKAGRLRYKWLTLSIFVAEVLAGVLAFCFQDLIHPLKYWQAALVSILIPALAALAGFLFWQRVFGKRPIPPDNYAQKAA
jgi:hypothetical protein